MEGRGSVESVRDEMEGMQDQLAQGLVGQARDFALHPSSATGGVHVRLN